MEEFQRKVPWTRRGALIRALLRIAMRDRGAIFKLVENERAYISYKLERR
jgi:hypothetical protein